MCKIKGWYCGKQEIGALCWNRLVMKKKFTLRNLETVVSVVFSCPTEDLTLFCRSHLTASSADSTYFIYAFNLILNIYFVPKLNHAMMCHSDAKGHQKHPYLTFDILVR